jgi:hypothetical protein
MTTEGIEGIYVETHNWGRTARFFRELGFAIEFETDHGSGMLRCGDGPYLFVEEVPADHAPGLQVLVRVSDAETCRPGPPVELVKPFEQTHWGPADAGPRPGWSHLEPAGTPEGAAVTNMDRLEEIVARLPQAERSMWRRGTASPPSA